MIGFAVTMPQTCNKHPITQAWTAAMGRLLSKKDAGPVGDGGKPRVSKQKVLGKTPISRMATIADLIPYARNSRTHSDIQVAQIAASIQEFGFLNPVIIDGKSGIIAGHGRVLAAQKLGIESVPVVEAAHLSEAQKRAYIIADNKLALNAGWDIDALKIEFDDLSEAGFDLDLTGFMAEEIVALDHADKGSPTAEEYKQVFEVVIACRDEPEQEAIFQMMTAKGLKCRVLSM